MKIKTNIQVASYEVRKKNFLSNITSESTFQVIVGNINKDKLLLWQDEFYMEEYLNSSKQEIVLSKIDTIEFLKFLKTQDTPLSLFIHPVFAQDTPVVGVNDLVNDIISLIESDGDFYDSLREHDLI